MQAPGKKEEWTERAEQRETAGKSWGMSEGDPRARPPCGSRAQNDLLRSGNEGLAGKLVHERFDREELVDP